jgi:predicted pyridoxine 5'-phosphate oxidase superfamily flavin-nucleotide-binding protein
MNITSVDALRELYAAPGERALRKQLSSLDLHCRRFIELSPFLVLATSGDTGGMDASPRGGAPGFVRIDRGLLPTLGQMLNDQTGLAIPVETQEEMVKRYAPDL